MSRGIDAPRWFAMLLFAGYLGLAVYHAVHAHMAEVRLDVCTYALADERALRTEAGYLALFFSGYVVGNIRSVDPVALHTLTKRLLALVELHPDVVNKLPTAGAADAAETMITSGLLEAEIDHD